MTQRLPIIVFAFVMAAIPFVPGMPPFWIVLLDNIGLAAAWVVAPNKSLILPQKYYELVKLHLPIPEPGPERQLPIQNTMPLQH